MAHSRPNPPSTRSAGKGGKPAGATKTAPAQSRRDKLASFEAARKKEQRNRTIRLLVICVVLAMALLAYPVYLFVDDYRARNADLGDARRRPGRGRLRPGRGELRPRATRTTSRTGPRSTYPSSRRPSASTTRSRRRSTGTFYTDGRPAAGRARWCTTWSTATPSPGTATARPAGRRPTPGADRQDLLRRGLQPGGQVHRRTLGGSDGGAVPGGQERRADPVDRRPERPRRHHQAVRRPPVLHLRQRPGDQGLHGQVPGRTTPPSRTAPDPAGRRLHAADSVRRSCRRAGW